MGAEILVSLSGGVDSVVLTHELSKERGAIRAIYFDIGYQPRLAERTAAKMTCHKLNIPLEIVDLRGIKDMVAGFVPIEDLGLGELDKGEPEPLPTKDGYVVGFPVLLATASYYAMLAQIPTLAVAFIKAQSVHNKGVPVLLNNWTATIGPLNPSRSLHLLAPFKDLEKSDVVKVGLELEVDFLNTWSCHRGGVIHCGECGGCIGRREAFAEVGIEDPARYAA